MRTEILTITLLGALAPATLTLASTPTATAATAAASTETTATMTAHTFEAQDGQTVEAEMGRLTVPQRRDVDGGGSVELAFVRFPSTAAEPGSPIVYLAGGPGGSGISAASGTRFPLFMKLREVADVIAFDQRGTGQSTPSLRCEEQYMVPFDRVADPAVAGPILADGARRCAARLQEEGVDLAGFTTAESVEDLEALRVALGAEKISLWGISYGTHLGLAAMRAYPERIDRVILAGIEGLDHGLKLPSDQQALLGEIARLAAADPVVAKRVPDLLASIERLLASLEKQPQTVSLTHPLLGMTADVTVGAFDLQWAIGNSLRGPRRFASLPDFVARLEDGDWTALALQGAQGRMGSVPNGMSVAMDCASGASAAWRARIASEAKSTLLGDAINFPYPHICAGVDVPDLGDAFRAPVKSTIPALLISGTLDGRTPPSNAEEVLPGLSRAHHLVIEGAGHSDPLFLSSPAILDAMVAFMRGGDVPAKISVPVTPFVAPRQVADLDDAKLARYVGEYRIGEGDVRRVLQAGDLLFTQRGDGQRVLPIRAESETRFFYEGNATWLDFELGDNGEVEAMVMHHSGASEGEIATRVVEPTTKN